MIKKSWAVAFIVLHLIQLLTPSSSVFAGHGNDSAGNPTSTSQLVNPATGDFSYSIPLLDIEGYPITLNYSAGIQLEQQASWVGLGWTLSPGAVNRQVRGIPDDFKGDPVITEINYKDNETKGGGLNIGSEITGKGDSPFKEGKSFFLPKDSPITPKLGLEFGAELFYNNYTGLGFETSTSLSANVSYRFLDGLENLSGGAGLSLNQSTGNQSGVTENIGQSVGLSYMRNGEKFDGGGSLSFSRNNNYNSIRGYNLESNSFSISAFAGNGKALGLGQGMSTVAFPSQAYSFTPTVNIHRFSTGYSVKFSGGGEVAMFYPYAGVNFNKLNDKLLFKQLVNLGYGHMYADQVPDSISGAALLDFNKEGEMTLNEETSILPFSYTTEDYFNLSSINGSLQFKTKRGDIGIYYSPDAITTGSSSEFEAEFGIGSYAEAGTNYSTSKTIGHTGKWNDYFVMNDLLAFQGKKANDSYEPHYFKPAGELTRATSHYDQLGGDRAVAFKLQKQTSTDYTPIPVLTNQNAEKPFGASSVLQGREQRLTTIFPVKANKGKYISPFEHIKDCSDYTNNGLQFDTLNRVAHTATSGFEAPHHITEIQVTHAGGNREYYSTPVYNRVKKEVSFNVENNAYDISTGLVNYSASDAGFNNTKGVDHYFKATTTPAYADQFLLNAVVSADYEDVTQDGPTVDDLGNYTLFHYNRTSENYRYRFPYEQGKAYFNEGLLGDSKDDKGSYVYGTKELWHLQSVESKNLVAKFYVSDRKDAHGVQGETGGISTASSQKMKRLDKIELYSKEDLFQNSSSAQPLKTIKFDYSYELCQGIPDQDSLGGGKLTLKGVTITDFTSLENSTKTYDFTYANNPDYANNAKDRWGFYKPNNAIHQAINSPGFLNMSPLTNSEYPYTAQDQATADFHAGAWNLSRIVTPTGSEINIEYEADSYAFVQDKKAMRMYKIQGFVNTLNAITADFDNGFKDLNLFMVVDLGEDALPVSTNNPIKQFRRRFLIGNQRSPESLFYKALVNSKGGTHDHNEWVTGYATMVKNYATLLAPVGGFYKYALIPIRPDKGDGQINQPIMRMSWQVSADYLGRYIIDGSNLEGVSGVEAFVQALEGQQEQKRISKQGFYKYMGSKRNGAFLIPNHSFVRLFDGDGVKYGGGHRVKEIRVKDNWEEFSDEYGTVYTYEPSILENLDYGTYGVSSNEPMQGGEDNTLFRNAEDLLTTTMGSYGRSRVSFAELPVGKAVLPGAGVIYSQVKQQSIQKNGVSLSRTGDITQEFYTSKDFPLKFDYTPIEKYFKTPKPKTSLFKQQTRVTMTASQGFSIVLNDMHGKPKKTVTRDENGNEISSIEYKYRSVGNELDNTIQTLNKNNQLTIEVSGVETSMCIATMESKIEVVSEQKQANVNIIPLPGPVPAPFPIPSPFWYDSDSQEKVRTITTSKVIQKYGILEEVITKDERASFSAKDLIYDQESRSPISSSATNYLNASKDILNVSYPAYWSNDYKNFGPSYKTIGYRFNEQVFAANGTVVSQALQITGTELLLVDIDPITPAFETYKVWVSKNDSGNYVLIDKLGSRVGKQANHLYALEVIRPGELNMTGATVQSLSMLYNGSTPHMVYSDTSLVEVISGQANTLIEDAQVVFNDMNIGNACSVQGFHGDGWVNPFLYGIKGSWNSHESFSLFKARDYANATSSVLGSIALEGDGVTTMKPKYYLTSNGLSYFDINQDWIETSRSTKITARQGVVEQRSANGVYSSQTFGNLGETALSAASNSRKHEQYFESFEDKLKLNTGDACFDERLKYANGSWSSNGTAQDLPNIAIGEAHTGDHSIVLDVLESKALYIPANVDTFSATDYAVPFRLQRKLYDQGIGRLSSDTAGYIVSFWIKRDNIRLPYDGSGLFSILDGTTPISAELYYESKIIDGWKQLTYLIPGSNISGVNAVFIKFENPWTELTYIDDIKISPWNGQVAGSTTTALYGRQEAQLDPMNFSTQYKFNAKGAISEVYRETERGLQTISSTRQSLEE